MRQIVIGTFELAFWVGILAAARWLLIVEKDEWTADMLLLVCFAFTIFTGFGYRYAWKTRASVPIHEDALRLAASGRTVNVGGVDMLPSEAVEPVLGALDGEALPSWLGLGQSVLVSLGLVGTFLGLTIGIYSAAGGILSPDPKIVQGAMGVLMGGAKLAFAKSLAGVVAAMIWSFRYGQLEDMWAERRARARAWLDETFKPLTSERLLAMTLIHLEATATQQVTRDTALKADVVVVGNKLGDLLTRLGTVDNTLVDRLSAVEKAVRAPGEDNVVAALGLLKADVVVVGTKLGELLTQLEGAEDSLVKRLSAVEEAVRTPGDDDVVTTLSSLRNTVSQLADALPEKMGAPIAGGISTALAASLNPKLDEVAKGIHALSESRGGLEQRVGDQVSGQVTELGGALTALQGAVLTLNEQLIALPTQVQTEVRTGTEAASQSLSRELVDAGQQVANRLSGAAAELATGSTHITLSVADLRTALAESAKVAVALRGAGDATAASLVGVQAPLDAAAAQVVAANLALAASTASATEAATAIRATAKTIAEAEPKLREAWRLEREAAERLLESTRKSLEPLAELTTQVEALRVGCGELLTAVKKSGGDQTVVTNEAGARLAEALTRFETGLAAITQTLDSQSGKLFQDAANRAADAAATVGKALQNGAEGFEASMTRMVERSESLEGLFVRLDALSLGLAEQQTTLTAGLTSAAAPLERAGASLSAAAPALEVARKSLESERDGLTGLSETLKGSASAVQSILVDTQKVRAALDLDVPARLREIELARQALEQAWKKAGGERDQAWTESARRLTEHVRALELANAGVVQAWADAERARTVGIAQNASEIAQYAEKVNQATRLPQRLTSLNETLADLVGVLDEIKRSHRGTV